MSQEHKIHRALISVYDKTGIVDFARALHSEFGIEIISTGGTAKTLTDAGIPVTLVEDVTGFPEMMDGRVKTLHPKIHAAILADRDNPEHMRQLKEQGIEPIDMVVVNLYPFEKTIAKPDCTFEEAIEMIDIGGPGLLRAAAKNHRHVLVCSDSRLNQWVLNLLRDRLPIAEEVVRRRLALSAIRATAAYDIAVANWLGQYSDEPGTASEILDLKKADSELRYAENPHQQGNVFHSDRAGGLSIVEAQIAQGSATTPMSFNNYADASAAGELCDELSRAMGSQSPHGKYSCCFVKHTNACGAAVDSQAVEAYRRAYLGDPNATMGGILAVDFVVDADFAQKVMFTYQHWGANANAGGFFVEVWIAPEFDAKAIDIIRNAKAWGERVRLLATDSMAQECGDGGMDLKRIAGGVLMQTRDLVGLNEDEWKVVTERQPTESEISDLRLAWLVCKHTKSNAITICKEGMLIGNGAGQMSRVMSGRIATWLAKENGHEEKLKGAVAASDAFFPFRDGPDALIDAGVTALIQPGGSKRDQEVIAACDERDVAMIFTGTRHFRH